MRKKALFSMTLAALLALTIVGCTPGADDPSPGPEGPGDDDPEEPTVKEYYMPVYDGVEDGREVSVHDPSIFEDPVSGTYYAYGSHFAVASTTDLINWTQEVNDGSNESAGQTVAQELYGDGVNWRNVLTQSVAFAGTGMPSTWAPDVVYHDGT